MSMVMKEKLKSLCCSNGWSYAVFWGFDQRNAMLLTMEDVYHEEQMGAVVDDMHLQVHMLGEGIVGEAASAWKHQWIFSDDDNGGWNSTRSFGSQDLFQDYSEIHHQFFHGIKTIAVISVASKGVIQFGSSEKIVERPEFLDQIKRSFMETENVGITSSVNQPSSLGSERSDLNEWFASFCNANVTSVQRSSCNELMEMVYTPIDPTQSSCFTSHVQQENTMHSSSAEAQAILSEASGAQLSRMALQSAASVDRPVAEGPCISAWSNGNSIVTSLESHLQSETDVHNSPNLFSTKAKTPPPCGNNKQNFQADSTITSFYTVGRLIDVGKTVQEYSGKSVSNENSAPPTHATEGELSGKCTSLLQIPEQFELPDFTTELSNSCVMDNLFEWFAPSPEFSISGMTPIMNENLPQPVEVPSGLDGNALVNNPFEQLSNSVQCSITRIYASGEKQKALIVSDDQNGLLKGSGLEFRYVQARDCCENIEMPVVNRSHLASRTAVSDSVSEMAVGSVAAPRKGLFSELGLEELLESSSNSSYISKSSTYDQLSATKRRRVETSYVNGSQVQFASVSCSSSSAGMQPTYLERTNKLVSKNEEFPKSRVGLWIDDSYSINNRINAQAKTKKLEEPTKITRKRARQGGSTRPRPKDRQQIQDRLKELKEIIPGGEKCSIDALLDRTIKHMLFLQSVTKYAEKLRQANEPKVIGQEKGKARKDDSTSGGGGATWALEVGDQTAVCPIMIEDIGPHGLMLIEMICEDRGFFLEIADVIKGFGLNILKGTMELREDEIWARFIVETNARMTRIEIFWSLVEFIQRTNA